MRVADVVQHVEHRRADEIEERRGLAAEQEFVDRAADAGGCTQAADLFVQPHPHPTGVIPGAHRLLERVGQRNVVGLRVESGWVAVALGERFGQWTLRQPRGLVQHVPNGRAVEVTEFTCSQHLLEIQHLEKVEL